MATPRSPQTPFSIPAQPKRSAFPSSIPSARRASTSNAISSPGISSVSVSTPSPLSPTPNTPTGIPTFRSLRSLLPFGPNKQPTPVSSTASPSTNVLRSPFANFGSVRRRSMNRERNASFSAELPVISIERTPESLEDPAIRKSVSCSRLEKPLPDEPPAESEGSSKVFQEDDDTIVLSMSQHKPRTPSPGPAATADLSTILEADTSGISKYIPSSPDPSRSPSPPFVLPSETENLEDDVRREDDSSRPEQETDTDTSVLDLSTTHLTNQVLDAMMAEDSGSAKQWLNSDKAIVIDEDDVHESLADTDAEPSFNLGALDPDLAALLSPNRLSSSSNIKHLSIIPQPRRISDIAQGSPNSPQFPDSNSSPSSPGFSSGPQKSLVRSRLPRQQSSLPRLRPPSVHSPVSPAFTVTPTTPKSGSPGATDDEARTTSVRNSSSESFGTQIQRHPPAPPSPLSSSLSASTHAPNSSATASTSNSTRSISSTSLSARRTVPQTRIVTPSTIFSRAAVPPTTSTPASTSRFSSFSGKRPPLRQMLSGPSSPSEWGENISPANWGDAEQTSRLAPSSPSRSTRASTPSRPSVDSTTRGSLDRSLRPSLESSPLAGDNSASSRMPFDSPERSVLQPSPRLPFDTPARPSLDLLRGNVRDRLVASTSSINALSARVRKRSMSVQERLGQSFRGEFTSSSGVDSQRRREESGMDDGRPSSSLSGRLGRKAGGDRPPATEWLGPRTVKAFKAAGLMDFERDGERSGNLSAVGRFASIRSMSEYSPRTHSRMAFSETGGSALGSSASRRGSGTFSQYGLMESPTFTASSGSRDTPRSASTAPTSVSGSSFAFLGSRDRDKDRDRDEIRELKEKHATETGALLGALSDSQRTTRLLRDENGELRERLESLGHVVVENEKLMRAVDELRKEVGDLRMQLLKAGSRLGTWGGIGTGRRSGLSTPIPPNEEDTWTNPRPTNADTNRDRDQYRDVPPEPNQKYNHLHYNHDRSEVTGPASSSTPAAKTHHRRFSTTSSIFPVPPSNMTMLLHDNDHDDVISNASMSHSRYSMTHTPPVSIRGKHNAQNSSIASVASISPTTANFSMVTGSPGSLFLRPEHEVHLGDLESLDLGVRSGDGEQGIDDDWDE